MLARYNHKVNFSIIKTLSAKEDEDTDSDFFFNSVIFCLQYLLLIVLSLCLVECIIKTCSQPFMFLMLSVCDGLFIGGGTH